MSNTRSWKAALAMSLPLVVVGSAVAQDTSSEHGTARNLSEMKFAANPALPACVQLAVQHGDPEKGAFTGAVQLKAGCTVPWHWHSANEQLMIIKGTPRMEMRDKEGGAAGPATKLEPGGYVYLPAKHQHQLKCPDGCTLFVESDGKFDIHYVDAQGKEIPVEQALAPATDKAKDKAKAGNGKMNENK
jgi:quercetin dioxygenase-like cupin family protein